MSDVPQKTLQTIEYYFHEVIRQRADELIEEHNLELPKLSVLLHGKKNKAWFPVPGMYGGFSYWLEGEGDGIKLISESWCRIVGGSGERHEVTAAGSRLVDEGFV